MLKSTQLIDPRQQMNHTTYEVFYYKQPRASALEVHHHDFYEVINILAGEVKYWIDGKIIDLKPGDLLLINPMELHRPIVNPDTQYDRFVLWINKNYLDTLWVDGHLSDCFRCTANHLPGSAITPIFSALASEYHSDRYGSKIYAHGLFLQLMVEINRIAPSGIASSERTMLISQILQHIGNNYHTDLSLDSLARHFHISKYHLSHQFKKETGTSLYHYITLKRLAAARQMLMDGMAPGTVCNSCGFRDYTVFYKAFKSEYGCAPTMTGQQN